MKNMALFLLLAVFIQGIAYAEELDDIVHADKENSAVLNYIYRFSNISINYFNWRDGTTERSAKEDFLYLELEGGAG